MHEAALLADFIRRIDAFLARETKVGVFSDEFFHLWQEDRTDWPDNVYKPLNEIALACECYASDARAEDPYELTEDGLRAECEQRMLELRGVLGSQ